MCFPFNSQKFAEFARWKRWDNWKNVAMRNPALWEQSMLEFLPFTMEKYQLRYSHICACALKRARHWRAGLSLALTKPSVYCSHRELRWAAEHFHSLHYAQPAAIANAGGTACGRCNILLIRSSGTRANANLCTPIPPPKWSSPKSTTQSPRRVMCQCGGKELCSEKSMHGAVPVQPLFVQPLGDDIKGR